MPIEQNTTIWLRVKGIREILCMFLTCNSEKIRNILGVLLSFLVARVLAGVRVFVVATLHVFRIRCERREDLY
jgi:hypothetical protein